MIKSKPQNELPQLMRGLTNLEVGGSLSHYTMSDTLKFILQPDCISLQASRIDNFWHINETQRRADDPQEFKGMIELINILDLGFKSEENVPKCVKKVYKNVVGEKEIKEFTPVIGSTTTPYVLCFSTSHGNDEIIKGFYEEKRGLPLSLKFNVASLIHKNDGIYEKFIENNKEEFKQVQFLPNESGESNSDGKSPSDNDGDIERVDISPIVYTSNKDKYVYEEALAARNEVIKRLLSDSLAYNEQLGEAVNIDACYFVKRGNYSYEDEVRFLVHRYHPWAFGIKQNEGEGKDSFKFEIEPLPKELCENSHRIAEYLYFKFDVSALQEIRFGESVTIEKLKDLPEKVKEVLKTDKYKNVTLCLHDGTMIAKQEL